jgi:hypothetical protein
MKRTAFIETKRGFLKQLFTGSAALQFSNLVEQEKKKYKMLAITGIGLSPINAIAGFIMRL